MTDPRPSLTTYALTATEGLRLVARRPVSAFAWMAIFGLSLFGSTLAGAAMVGSWWEEHVAVLGELEVMTALGGPVFASGLALVVPAIYRAQLQVGPTGFAFLRLGRRELAMWPWAAAMAALFFGLAALPPKGPAHYLLLAAATVLATPFTYVGPAIVVDGWRGVGGAIRLAVRDGPGLLLMNLGVLAIYVAVRWPTSRLWADHSRASRDPATGVPVDLLLNALWLGLATLTAFTLWLVLSAASAISAYDRASSDVRADPEVFD